VHGITDPVHPGLRRGGDNQVGDDLGICGGTKRVTLLGKLIAQEFGIDDITIVGYRYGIVATTHHERLHIDCPTGATGGVTIVANSDVSGELAQPIFVKDLRHQPHVSGNAHPLAVSDSDAGAFLTTVLQSKQSEEGKPGHILIRTIDAKDSATLVQACPFFRLACPIELYTIVPSVVNELCSLK